MMKNIGLFMEKFALGCSSFSGTSLAFTLALLLVILWAACGPIFKYSEIWQMVINTATTIITFLMVFLIQRAQNKDILSIHAKLNELIAAQEGASNKLVNIEDATEEELINLRDQYRELSGPDDEGTERKSLAQLGEQKTADVAAAKALVKSEAK